MSSTPAPTKTPSVNEVEEAPKAFDLVIDSNETFVEATKEEKALVRKIDLYLIPTVWILYIFSYIVSPICEYSIAYPVV